MPKDSEEYLYYKTLCGNYEAFFYDDLGAILKRAGNPIAITHFKKARAICNLLGMTETAKRLDCKISLYSSAVEAAANNDSEATAKYDWCEFIRDNSIRMELCKSAPVCMPLY